MTVLYDLLRSWMISISLVATPTQTIKMPLASGSSVPAWPTLTRGKQAATWFTSSREVGPLGLSRTMIPAAVGRFVRGLRSILRSDRHRSTSIQRRTARLDASSRSN